MQNKLASQNNNNGVSQREIELHKQIAELLSMIQDLNEKQENSSREIEAMKRDKEEKDKIIEDLQNERKEMEIELNELREEVKQFRMQNIDPKNYKQWKSDEVVTWICSLDDGEYKCYEDMLRSELKKQSIDGGCFEEIDGQDVKLWGIENFRHRKAIVKHIESVVNGGINANNNVACAAVIDKEGTDPPTAFI